MKIIGGPFGTLVLTRDAQQQIQQTDVKAGETVDFKDEVVRSVDFAAPAEAPVGKTDRFD